MRNARTVSLSLVATSMLSASVATANAGLQLTIGGNTPGADQINAGDPVALSDVLRTDSANVGVSAGSASGAADLSAGTLRCRTSGMLVGQGSYFPAANASFGDKVTFTGGGATVNVKLALRLEGITNLTSVKDHATVQNVIAHLSIGPVQHTAGIRHGYTIEVGQENHVEYFQVIGNPADSVSSTGVQGTAVTLSLEEDVPTGTPTDIGVMLGLQGNGSAGDSEVLDYGNTARLSMILPDGVTFTSASGAFLTHAGEAGLPVPDDDGGVGVRGAPLATGASDAGTGFRTDASSPGDGATPTESSSSDDGGCATAPGDVLASGWAAALGALGIVIARRRSRHMQVTRTRPSPAKLTSPR